LSDLGVFGGGLVISVADLRAGGEVFPGVARRAVQTGAVRSVALRCDPNEGAGGDASHHVFDEGPDPSQP
jgi:hypothetical protein